MNKYLILRISNNDNYDEYDEDDDDDCREIIPEGTDTKKYIGIVSHLLFSDLDAAKKYIEDNNKAEERLYIARLDSKVTRTIVDMIPVDEIIDVPMEKAKKPRARRRR